MSGPSSSSARWGPAPRCCGSCSTATSTSGSRPRPASCAATTRCASRRSSGRAATGPAASAGARRSSTRSRATSTTGSSCATPSSTASAAGARRRRCTPGTSTTWRGSSRMRSSSASCAIPTAAIASNMTRFTSRLARATWQWAQPAKELVRQADRLPGRFVIVRYEELVTRPEPVLRELLEWLGEPWSPAVLEHHAVQGGRGGPTRVEGRSRADDPIDETRVAKWTTAMLERAPRVAVRAGRPAGRLLRLRARRPAGARARGRRTAARCCARRS